MKKSSAIVLGALLMFIISSCQKRIRGEGPVVTETRAITNFTKIALHIPATLYVTQEAGYKCTIDAQQNILDILETPVSGGELKIKFPNGKNISSSTKIIIRISAPLYNKLNISGSGDISANGVLQTNALQLEISGSGSIYLNTTEVTGTLEASISGSGNVQINDGTAVQGTLHISGSGSIEALAVTMNDVEAHISGSGHIKATVSHLLEAHISGSGSIYYKGTPTVNAQVSGSGTVKKI